MLLHYTVFVRSVHTGLGVLFTQRRSNHFALEAI